MPPYRGYLNATAPAARQHTLSRRGAWLDKAECKLEPLHEWFEISGYGFCYEPWKIKLVLYVAFPLAALAVAYFFIRHCRSSKKSEDDDIDEKRASTASSDSYVTADSSPPRHHSRSRSRSRSESRSQSRNGSRSRSRSRR